MLDSYTEWLNFETTTSTFGEYIEITVPYVDRSNDYLQIYLKLNPNETIELTDDGLIIGNLAMVGVDFEESNNRRKLEEIAKRFNVAIDNNTDIVAIAAKNDFPRIFHQMIQAMLLIDNLF